MTDSEIHRGLEDVTVVESRLSDIDGAEGELTIAGFSVDEIATRATFEEMVYLLWNDRLPTADELSEFEHELAKRRSVPDVTLDQISAAVSRDLPSMDVLRMGVASASLNRDREENPRQDAYLAIAQLPTVAAAYWRLREGKDPVEPRTDLSHAANYLYMLTGEAPTDEQTRGLETYLNAVVDHGLNASTFTARSIVSTESDVVSAVTGAVGALKGPLHGGAPGPVLEMLQNIRETGDPEAYVREAIERGDRLMGFGHRVYSVRDPRAEVLSEAAERFYGDDGEDDFFANALEVENVAVQLLAEYKPDLTLNTNVEFYTAVLLHGLGVPIDMFSPTFAIGRVGGWTAHCLEQLQDNRIIRPRAKYAGDTGREWVPVDRR